MTAQYQYLKEVFKEPLLIAYKRQNNIRDILIKAKVPPAPNRYPHREVKGMAKCGKNCTACPYIQTGNKVKICENEVWKITNKVNCETSGFKQTIMKMLVDIVADHIVYNYFK